MKISSDFLVRKTEFRERLSYWLRKAEAGKRLLISDRGRPIAVIVPWRRGSKAVEEEFVELADAIDLRAIPWDSLRMITRERRRRTLDLSKR